MTTLLNDENCSVEPSTGFNAAEYDYILPPEQIAQRPPQDRSGGRLLLLDRTTKATEDCTIRDLPRHLCSKDLLIFNDTRVIPARIFGHKASGGKVEALLERILPDNRMCAQLRANRAPKIGSELIFFENVQAQLEAREGRFCILKFAEQHNIEELLEQYGKTPLPPYIRRSPEPEDRDRYQTVYAREAGAIAAPTAGLHFDEALLQQLEQQGVQRGFVTLHVGAGTFQPMDAEDIREHRIHAEHMTVSAELCDRIRETRTQGGRVIAVGTTSVRALESAAVDGEIKPFSGDTQLYLYPGCKFSVIDGMLTNFHLPKSSLLVMVCAFADRETVLAAYRHAIERNYRFYSYGDAMLIT